MNRGSGRSWNSSSSSSAALCACLALGWLFYPEQETISPEQLLLQGGEEADHGNRHEYGELKIIPSLVSLLGDAPAEAAFALGSLLKCGASFPQQFVDCGGISRLIELEAMWKGRHQADEVGVDTATWPATSLTTIISLSACAAANLRRSDADFCGSVNLGSLLYGRTRW